MFAKFKMQLSDGEIQNDYGYYGEKQKNKALSLFQDDLKLYLLEDGSLNAAQLEEEWFPNIKADIFISHSHADEQLALNLAGFLKKEYEITSFIDSTIWGHVHRLLRKIDNKYCIKEIDQYGKQIYSYQRRNQSTACVYLLLQGALAKMIDRCECIIFINTPHSIKPIRINEFYQTASPWIYNELLMADLLRPRKLEAHREDELMHFITEQFSYPVNFDSFIDLRIDDFKNAANKVTVKSSSAILKQLYHNKGFIR